MKKISILGIYISILIFTTLLMLSDVHAAQSSTKNELPYIILSSYGQVMDIGDEFWLYAYTSTGKKPSFKSSNSKVASVNTYGYITAKNNGTAYIIAKINNAEARCYITVLKTKVTLNRYALIMEHGALYKLNASSSTGNIVTWKSNKSSVVSVDDRGFITANKPGDAIITAKVDSTEVRCKVKVKSPTLTINSTSLKMFRLSTASLKVTVSSGLPPVWRSNRSSVATVDQNGFVTAVKNGTATITATVDGVSVSCTVNVKKPDIILSETDITLKEGKSTNLTAKVCSGNIPIWTSNNNSVATVSSTGKVKAHKKGTATITVTEDGTKVKCKVHVIR